MLRQTYGVGVMLTKVMLAFPKHVTFPASQYVHAIEGFPKLK